VRKTIKAIVAVAAGVTVLTACNEKTDSQKYLEQLIAQYDCHAGGPSKLDKGAIVVLKVARNTSYSHMEIAKANNDGRQVVRWCKK
jgi:hypothetical protein